MTASPLSEDEQNVYSAEEMAKIDPAKVPGHIAIMMDGNRRWARKQKLLPVMGHWEGAEALSDIVRAAIQLKIKTLTVYAFSTENWSRSESEIEVLMNIFQVYLDRKRALLVKEGIRLDVIGDISQLPPKIQRALEKTKSATEQCRRINLVLAINYGGRDEIRRVIAKILARNDEKKILPDELTEKFISQFFDTSPWGDPDLLIRTSGEMRVSNFLLWQISYTELFVTDVLWPSFTPKELLSAVLAFQSRERRIGGG